MILAVDIGNSNIVLGCFEGDRIKFSERLSTDRSATELEYLVLIRTILELNGTDAPDIQGGIISSVVPSVTQTVKDAIIRLTGKQVMTVGPGMKTGLRIMLDDPAQLGSDCVAGAVAAVNEYPCPLIIIDMGTATTVSVIDGGKNFLGGMIIPGLKVSLDSLISGTSQLPRISLDPPKKLIGSNTIDCMKSGIIYGTVSTVDGMIERIEEDLGAHCTTVSTGGLASRIIPYCKHDIIIDDQLLLKGLMIIYNKNRT